MRRCGFSIVLLAAVAQTALAGPREDALAVVGRWSEAFNASDVDAIVGLYAADATFLGTGSGSVVTAREEIRAYFERALLTDRPRGARFGPYEVQEIGNDAAIVTGLDTTSRTRDGEVVETPGRVTFVVARRGGEWRIVHFHRSAQPGA